MVTWLMKKVLYFLSLYLCAFFAVPASLNVGVVNYPPHINVDDELENSPLIEYINSVFNSLNIDVVYIKLPSGRATVELMEGRLDILMPVPNVTSEMATLFAPIFHEIPGLCFKKENFIPILSATHLFNNLTIGFPVNASLVSVLASSKANLVPLKGDDAINRGIELTQRGRFDAFYHPSPVQVYHRKNPNYKELACSYFHGYSKAIYIAVANENIRKLINSAYQKALKEQSYEYFFASRK